MDSHIVFGYIGALLIGIVLGLAGGGGSILTVPILVYIMAIEPVLATAYSLFVVGVAAAVGAARNLQKGLVDIRTAVIFAIPAFIAVYATRRWLVPAIPDSIAIFGDYVLTKSMAIMIFFAIIMLLAAFSMIRKKKPMVPGPRKAAYNYPMIIIEGLVVGIITGVVGAGGGFLIIPALVLLAGLPMKKAIGTSLLIIACKSLIGFVGDVQNLIIDWTFLMTFTGIAIAGILLGMYLSSFIEGQALRRGFGWFVLVIAFGILWRELG